MRRPPVIARFHHLHIRLDNIEPAIERELIVPSGLNLGRLHLIIQAVMGWDNSHLHEFIVGQGRNVRRFGPADTVSRSIFSITFSRASSSLSRISTALSSISFAVLSSERVALAFSRRRPMCGGFPLIASETLALFVRCRHCPLVFGTVRAATGVCGGRAAQKPSCRSMSSTTPRVICLSSRASPAQGLPCSPAS